MATLTQDQRDDLLLQNAASIKRQADAADALVVAFKAQGDQLLSRRGEVWMALYQAHLSARATALTTATTDATLTDIVRDAVLMTNAALAGFDAAGV